MSQVRVFVPKCMRDAGPDRTRAIALSSGAVVTHCHGSRSNKRRQNNYVDRVLMYIREL